MLPDLRLAPTRVRLLSTRALSRLGFREDSFLIVLAVLIGFVTAAVLTALEQSGLVAPVAERAALLNEAVMAVLPVFDAQMREYAYQRNKEFASVATDDRAMAAQFSLAADTLAASSSS